MHEKHRVNCLSNSTHFPCNENSLYNDKHPLLPGAHPSQAFLTLLGVMYLELVPPSSIMDILCMCEYCVTFVARGSEVHTDTKFV